MPSQATYVAQLIHGPDCGCAPAWRHSCSILAGSALAAPRLERERCTFKPPRGERIECYVLIVPENRDQPEGREVRLKVAVLKAKRTRWRRAR